MPTEPGQVPDSQPDVGPGVVPDEVLAGLGAELTRLSRRRSVAPGSQLDRSAFWVLWALTEGGATSLRDIADVLDLDQSTVSRQVAAAVRNGWAARTEVGPGHAHAVAVTAEGTAALDHDREMRALRYRTAAAAVGPQVLARLTEDLRAFNDAMDGASQQP